MFEPVRGDGPEDRHRILVATAAILERTGYQSLKMRQVATAAGTSIGVVYRHFPSKTDLMMTLLREDSARMTAMLADLMARTSCPAGRVEAWLEFGIRIWFDTETFGQVRCYGNPDLQRDCAQELTVLSMAAVGLLRTAIEDGVRAGAFRSTDPERDALAVYRNLRLCLEEVAIGVTTDAPATVLHHVLGHALQALGAEPV